MNFIQYSKLIVTHLIFVYLTLSLNVQASEYAATQPASLNSSVFGPVAKDCSHERIFCFEGNNNIFAVKGPLTVAQVNNLCPSTPKQNIFKRHPLPSTVINSVIIVNMGDSVYAYNQNQYRVQKNPFDEQLPKFSYVLCGTTDNTQSYGRHLRADNPIPLDDFLAGSLAFDNIKNPPSNKVFKASDRTFAFQDVMLGDSTSYLTSLFPSSEVNYEISGNYIVGYDFTAQHGDVLGKFDKEEQLYEFTITLRKEDISLTATLEEFVYLYGNPVVKGGSTLEHDLDPNNKVNSGSYIWKVRSGTYLTLIIDETKKDSVTVKMVDISRAEKAAKDLARANK